MSAGKHTPFRGVPQQLQHDLSCPIRTGRPHFTSCNCGEYQRDPDLWRIIRPHAYVATLAAIGERREFTPYVAQLPARSA